MFATEESLAKAAIPILKSIYSIKKRNLIIKEPTGLFGIPDLMFYADRIISIEFKLRNWKRALIQAFRYKSFSSLSYVILDEDCSNAAIKNIDMFKQYNVGLCSFDGKELITYYEPLDESPFSEPLYEKALSYFI